MASGGWLAACCQPANHWNNYEMTPKLTTSWMWLDDGEMRGLSVDVPAGVLHWHDQIGCNCAGEDFMTQTVQEFRQSGCPPLIGDLPIDVRPELEQVLDLIGSLGTHGTTPK